MGKTKPPKGAKKTTVAPAAEANGAAGPTPENMTLAEAAAWLRVSEGGLRADAAAGRVPARFVAGEWRFNKPALVAWLSQPESPPNRPKTGAELVARVEELNRNSPYKETPEEVEAFIAELYKLRKTMWSGG